MGAGCVGNLMAAKAPCGFPVSVASPTLGGLGVGVATLGDGGVASGTLGAGVGVTAVWKILASSWSALLWR